MLQLRKQFSQRENSKAPAGVLLIFVFESCVQRIQNVDASGINFSIVGRSYVHVHFVKVRHVWRIQTPGLKMDGEAGEDSGHHFAAACSDSYGLCELESIKDRVRRRLWQSLYAQKSGGGNGRHYITRFIHGCNDKPMWGSGTQGDEDISQIICFRLKTGQNFAKFASQLLLVAR